MQTSRLLPVTYLILAMGGIQLGAAMAKGLFPAVGPQGAAALRLCLAALILCALWRPWKARLSRREALSVLVYGLSIGGMNLLVYCALTRIPLGIAIALEFTGPLAVALLASRRLRDFLWVALAVTGIALLLPLTAASAALDPLGIAYALCAGLCWFLYIIFGQKSGATLHGGTATALGMGVAALLVLPFGIAQAGVSLLSPALLPLALAIAVLASVIPYSLEMHAMARLPAKSVGILMSLEPALGTLCGRIFLDERLAFTQYSAIFCIILASLGSTMATGKTAGVEPLG